MAIKKKKKLEGIPKGKKHSLKREQASEPDTARMLELSSWEFKTLTIHMLMTLMDKLDSMQEQMGKVSREMEILEPTRTKKNLEEKSTVTEMKNTFDGLISRLDTPEEKISALEDISIESLNIEEERLNKG